jgi:hypothetical protein
VERNAVEAKVRGRRTAARVCRRGREYGRGDESENKDAEHAETICAGRHFASSD